MILVLIAHFWNAHVFWIDKIYWKSSWRYYRLTVDWFRTMFRNFAGFLWYLVTCLGFLLWCYRFTYLHDDKVATVYRCSSHSWMPMLTTVWFVGDVTSLSLSQVFLILNNKTRLRLHKMNPQSFRSAATGNSKMVFLSSKDVQAPKSVAQDWNTAQQIPLNTCRWHPRWHREQIP